MKNTKSNRFGVSEYADCVITNKDGQKRIGRIEKGSNYFTLASYQMCKTNVVWSFDDVVEAVEVIPSFNS